MVVGSRQSVKPCFERPSQWAFAAAHVWALGPDTVHKSPVTLSTDVSPADDDSKLYDGIGGTDAFAQLGIVHSAHSVSSHAPALQIVFSLAPHARP